MGIPKNNYSVTFLERARFPKMITVLHFGGGVPQMIAVDNIGGGEPSEKTQD